MSISEPPHIHAEIQYNSLEIGMVHSDLCTSEIDDYRELPNKCLDEFLNNCDADGYFAVGNFKIGD